MMRRTNVGLTQETIGQVRKAAAFAEVDIQDLTDVAARRLAEKIIKDFQRQKSTEDIRAKYQLKNIHNIQCGGDTGKNGSMQGLSNTASSEV